MPGDLFLAGGLFACFTAAVTLGGLSPMRRPCRLLAVRQSFRQPTQMPIPLYFGLNTAKEESGNNTLQGAKILLASMRDGAVMATNLPRSPLPPAPCPRAIPSDFFALREGSCAVPLLYPKRHVRCGKAVVLNCWKIGMAVGICG